MGVPILYIPLTLAKEPFWLPLGLAKTWFGHVPPASVCFVCTKEATGKDVVPLSPLLGFGGTVLAVDGLYDQGATPITPFLFSQRMHHAIFSI